MTNPLLHPSSLPYQLPPFAEIKVEHYRPAFDEALARHDAELAAITENTAVPTWENTVEALERSGQDLDRVMAVFGNLSGTDVTDEMEVIAADIYPRLSAHYDAMYQDEKLYQRIKDATPPAGDEEGARLHEHLLRTFARQGADLDAAGKARLSDINQRLSALSEEFGRNLMASTRERAVEFTEEELEGLPPERIASAKADAKALGREGYVIPLELPTVQSEQSRLAQEGARRKLYAASASRGSENNIPGLIEAVQLRAERAELLGYASHADYVIAEETAGSADAARDMLADLAPAAAANAAGEHKLLAEEATLNEQDFHAADWPYWESKVRARDFSLDEEELRQYFPLDNVLTQGVFAAAERLYGITVIPREDLEGYAEGVRVWEVFDKDVEHKEQGEHGDKGIGLLLTDYFGRPTKRGGAWMSQFVGQSGLLERKPVIVNVLGITKPADGSQPLLSLDEVHTLFHEFGHALHGLLSDVHYPTFAGTNVPRDWVEFPSQINENWALDKSLVKQYARHVDTGDPISDELLDAVTAASEFGQGFATSEYLAASIIDLAWHSLSAKDAAALDATSEAVDSFEEEALRAVGLDNPHIAPRYRSTYFNHIFAGGYSAGYYSYLWAEALDADGFEWFKEQSDLRAAGQKFRDLILSRGASRDFGAAYRDFRGRDKDVAPLLKRRGLSGT
ncbi:MULTISPECIES: M3 family metallopeptidase [unclassified Corynebacterium]|uniref:M3 family metallopeptidase n=1 Tax=unclassified Corynebacterium TaxID=2624378 RepID=UPI001EF4542C|nr:MULTISPECIES: M3 family metallopeptidase [unclassified Corynebacterium]MCG7244151.1 M3 family metallopeptidase [Corynebacterium sp. ACRPS]MCG7272170.1 M3 family metallopeptidase [Corynebacterium sp. ACRQM]MCG7234277.1 M3 family metallopeptidase [Corynebacterium sp. ACRPR]MDK8473527.1 M3 family metallopeptidase [Corynebacterium sp. MSK078]MDK8659409.1 M3 family metallopeptidase [Corynebacterium sp. MSK204]